MRAPSCARQSPIWASVKKCCRTGCSDWLEDGVDPFGDAPYVLHSKRADRIEAVWWDVSGACLFAKTLEETKCCWPKIAPTRVQLSHAQLLAPIGGLDWPRARAK
jgi:transposase